MRTGEPVSRIRSRSRRPLAQSGYAFVVVLMLLTLVSLGLAAAGPAYSSQAQREREQELLRIGALYAQALQDYYDAAPGNLRQYPKKLEQLLRDTRYVGTVRHLRKLYADPLQPGTPWGLVRDRDDGIVGVYSTSAQEPIAQAGGPVAPARRYSDWKFTVKANQ